MLFLGSDARHPSGNLLEACGFERIARQDWQTEGSSRYRRKEPGGLLEFHSFCLGWYPVQGPGVVFVRHQRKLHACDDRGPVTPGDYVPRILALPVDDLLELARPLAQKIVEYERQIALKVHPSYRAACWKQGFSKPNFRPWLEPDSAMRWLTCFAENPATTPRARDFPRSTDCAENRPMLAAA